MFRALENETDAEEERFLFSDAGTLVIVHSLARPFIFIFRDLEVKVAVSPFQNLIRHPICTLSLATNEPMGLFDSM
jgi:hypothetical protein